MTCLAAVLLFTACNNEEQWFESDLIPATFSPTLACEVDVEVDTRVVNNTWSGTETVGISQVASGGSLATSATWYQYKATANNPATTATLTPSGSVLYYPVDGSNVNFFAFSPYVAPTSANLVTIGAIDQSTQAKLEAVDFIWAKATGTHNKTSPNVSLGFAHKASKVIVKVTAGTGVSTTDIGTSAATLTFATMPYGAQYKLSDGVLNGSITTGTITPYKNTSLLTTTSVTWEAIVPPHAGTSYTSRIMNFTFNGKGYTYTFPTSDTYVAGTSYTYDLTLTTSGVVLQSTTVSNWTGGTTSWNGGKYVLHTTSSDLTFSPGASSQTLQIQYQGSTTAPVAVTSTSATSSTAGAVDWLTATVATSTTTSSPWTQRTLTVTATANTTTTTRTGFIHVSLEGLSVVITVTQGGIVTQGDANCYIVAPGTSITIPLSRAVTYGGASSSATFTATKLWDDAGAVTSVGTPSGTGSSATVTITASNIPGNAVVAAQVGGVTYWSYHIWVTSYNPNVSNFTNTYNTNKSGIVFMDRNLGATLAGVGAGYGTGLFYQWGRKDPFPATLAYDVTQPGGGSFGRVAVSATTGTVAYAIANPSVFIYGSSSSGYDWHWGTSGSARTDRDDTLWGHGNTTAKSPYDPCPAGWRVPSHNVAATSYASSTASPWNGFTVALGGTWSNGYTWGTNAQYPAAGYRSYSSSALTNVGAHGYYWSASPSSSTSYYASILYFYSGYVGVNTNGNRANGYSVRCVRE